MEITDPGKFLGDYRDWCLLHGQAKLTIENRVKVLQRVLNHCERKLDREHVTAYILELYKQGNKPTYIRSTIDVLHSVFHYLEDSGVHIDCPLTRPKDNPSNKSVFSDEEIKRFFELKPEGREIKGIFNKFQMFFRLCCDTGARTCEIAALRKDQIHLENKTITIEAHKTNSIRVVPIPETLYPYLESYIKTLKTEQLFPRPRGGGVIIREDWDMHFHKRLKRLGISRPGLSTYSFRHTMGTQMVDEDVSIFKIQRQLGHKRLETTAKYIHLGTKDMQETIAKLPRIRQATSPEFILQKIIEVIKHFELEKDKRFIFKLAEENNHLMLDVTISKVLAILLVSCILQMPSDAIASYVCFLSSFN